MITWTTSGEEKHTQGWVARPPRFSLFFSDSTLPFRILITILFFTIWPKKDPGHQPPKYHLPWTPTKNNVAPCTKRTWRTPGRTSCWVPFKIPVMSSNLEANQPHGSWVVGTELALCRRRCEENVLESDDPTRFFPVFSPFVSYWFDSLWYFMKQTSVRALNRAKRLKPFSCSRWFEPTLGEGSCCFLSDYQNGSRENNRHLDL